MLQEAFVSVPLNNEVINPIPDKDGQHRIDGKKVMEVAVRMGGDPSIQWSIEGEPQIEPHPTQNPPLSARN